MALGGLYVASDGRSRTFTQLQIIGNVATFTSGELITARERASFTLKKRISDAAAGLTAVPSAE